MQLIIELKEKLFFKEIENLDNFFLIGERAASRSLPFSLSLELL